MRNLRNPRLERGEVRIEDIELDIKSRDDIPALLFGLQYLYSQKALRDRIFALMDEYILPGVNRKVGRPGMAMWSIMVLAVVKQGLGCDFDRLHELANQHIAIRQFLGHADTGDKRRYHYQTLVDNVNLLTPKLLGKINHLIVESGHTVMGKKPGEPLRGRCDSFVVETNVHYPTDVNLSWDAMRCMLRYAGRAGSKHEVPLWRQWKQLQVSIKDKFNRIRNTDNVLPKKGRLSKAERDREQGETFAAMRRQHPAVESAINNLEHRGLDRVRSKGREGFARTVALSDVALNVHRLGRVLRQQARERHRLAA